MAELTGVSVTSPVTIQMTGWRRPLPWRARPRRMWQALRGIDVAAPQLSITSCTFTGQGITVEEAGDVLKGGGV